MSGPAGRGRPVAVVCALLLLALGTFASPGDAGPDARVHRVRIEGAITPATVALLDLAFEQAMREDSRAVLIELDTPGGLLSSTQTIVKAFLGAPLPVLVWVGPGGAGAVSAGVFITMAAHVAAMAPGTSIGASTPVTSSGEGLGGDMGKKVKNFTASFARSIAEQRGRNVDWAMDAVLEAATATDREALEIGVVDLVAPSIESLLEFASGRVVSVGEESVELDLAGAQVIDVEMPLRLRVMGFLADPNVAYFLFMAALLGLYLELSNPGMLVPGVVGVVCLLISAAAFQILPINASGLALVALGIGMLVAELFLPSFGVVGAGGVVALVLGSLLLFDGDDPGLVVDRSLIGGVAAGMGIVLLSVAVLVMRGMRGRVQVGAEALKGARGEVRARLDPAGTVFVHGEVWQARADASIEVGRPVRVRALEGLTLYVEPLEAGASGVAAGGTVANQGERREP